MVCTVINKLGLQFIQVRRCVVVCTVRNMLGQQTIQVRSCVVVCTVRSKLGCWPTIHSSQELHAGLHHQKQASREDIIECPTDVPEANGFRSVSASRLSVRLCKQQIDKASITSIAVSVRSIFKVFFYMSLCCQDMMEDDLSMFCKYRLGT